MHANYIHKGDIFMAFGLRRQQRPRYAIIKNVNPQLFTLIHANSRIKTLHLF